MIPAPSPICVELVKHFESFQPKAYRDAAGVLTVGYGSTYRPDGYRVQAGDTLSVEAAEQWLAMDLAEISQLLGKRLPGVTLVQHECDAVCSLVYNIGIGNFQISTVRRALLRDDWPTAAKGFLSWTKAGGKVLKGLVRRRHTERALFLGKPLEQAYRDGWEAIGQKPPGGMAA